MDHDVVKVPVYRYSFRPGEAEAACGISDQLDLTTSLEGCTLEISGATAEEVSMFSAELVAHGIEPVMFSHP